MKVCSSLRNNNNFVIDFMRAHRKNQYSFIIHQFWLSFCIPQMYGFSIEAAWFSISWFTFVVKNQEHYCTVIDHYSLMARPLESQRFPQRGTQEKLFATSDASLISGQKKRFAFSRHTLPHSWVRWLLHIRTIVVLFVTPSQIPRALIYNIVLFTGYTTIYCI